VSTLGITPSFPGLYFSETSPMVERGSGNVGRQIDLQRSLVELRLMIPLP
jgi:hypothetical protein